MFERNLILRNIVVSALASVCVVGSSSCSKGSGNGVAQVTPQGTVQLENLRAGLPENIFKDAVITFVVDPSPAASANGKTQYVSRAYDKKGGQYIAQCKDGKCFGLQVYYQNTPASKEDAVEALKLIVPADAAPQSKVDDTDLKAGKSPNEYYYFGDQYSGVIVYADKEGSKVKSVSAFLLPGDDLKAAYSGHPGKAKEALSKVKSAEESVAEDKAAPATGKSSKSE